MAAFGLVLFSARLDCQPSVCLCYKLMHTGESPLHISLAVSSKKKLVRLVGNILQQCQTGCLFFSGNFVLSYCIARMHVQQVRFLFCNTWTVPTDSTSDTEPVMVALVWVQSLVCFFGATHASETEVSVGRERYLKLEEALFSTHVWGWYPRKEAKGLGHSSTQHDSSSCWHGQLRRQQHVAMIRKATQ